MSRFNLFFFFWQCRRSNILLKGVNTSWKMGGKHNVTQQGYTCRVKVEHSDFLFRCQRLVRHEYEGGESMLRRNSGRQASTPRCPSSSVARQRSF